MKITNDKIKLLIQLKAEMAELSKNIKNIEAAIKDQGPIETSKYVIDIKKVDVKEYTVKSHVREQIVIVERK